MEDPFLTIRPYTEIEAKEAIRSLAQDPYFLSAVQSFSDEKSYLNIVNEFKSVNSTYDFQYHIIKKLVSFIIQETTDGISCSGIENLSSTDVYLFIGNHRDIVLDSVFLQQYFLTQNFKTTKIAFGDNLMTSPTLEKFFKSNKMFVVKRGGTIKEKLLNSQQLSKYIYHSLFHENESIWIAQRNGRTKNGIDKTQQGLVKMLANHAQKDILNGLKKLKIVPVSISYEYESCDQLKAREMVLSEKKEYVKLAGEDFKSMQQGIFGYKGKVNVSIGTPIVDEIDNIDKNLRPNEKIVEVCRLIDQQIYANYKLFENNFIAYDLLENKNEFSSHYSETNKNKFINYIDKQSVIDGIDQAKMRNYLLKIYANPVKTSFGKISIAEDNNW